MDDRLYRMIESLQKGDEQSLEEICKTYQPLLDSSVQSFFDTCPGSDKDDLAQEAVMALYKAARSYRLGQDKVTFGLYAQICIRNRLISFRRKQMSAQRPKPVKTTPSHRDFLSRVDWESPDTQKMLVCLSFLEKKVLRLYVERCSYREIAESLSLSVKSVDNAIYRIRRKLKNFKSK